MAGVLTRQSPHRYVRVLQKHRTDEQTASLVHICNAIIQLETLRRQKRERLMGASLVTFSSVLKFYLSTAHSQQQQLHASCIKGYLQASRG